MSEHRNYETTKMTCDLIILISFCFHIFCEAFDTATGMPYGTVNLRHGVPKGETTVTCTACIGTFIIEFGTLSRLTGDPVFEKTAIRAIRVLWKYRSPLGLVRLFCHPLFFSLLVYNCKEYK